MASTTSKKVFSTAVMWPFQNMPLFLLLLDLGALSFPSITTNATDAI